MSLYTDELELRVDRATGALGFYELSGNPLLLEKPDGGKSLTPSSVGGMDTLRSRLELLRPAGEAIYGLGQHQQGLMNYQNTTVHLQQKNMEVGVPVLVSSRGYGVLWDNPAVTDISTTDGDTNSPGQLAWTSEASDAIDFYFM